MPRSNGDYEILSSISGKPAQASLMQIEDGYLQREMRENLEAQGFDVEAFGFEPRENTYSVYERGFHQANRDVSACESIRADLNIFDNPDLDLAKEREEAMEERTVGAVRNTEKRFIEAISVPLEKARFTFKNAQYWSDENTHNGDRTFIWLENDDLKTGRRFTIGSASFQEHNFSFKIGTEEPISMESGEMRVTRSKDKDCITIILDGTFKVKVQDKDKLVKGIVTREYRTEGQIWIAEEVDKAPEPKVTSSFLDEIKKVKKS